MTVTEVRPGQKNRRRFNVYVDEEFAFACFADTLSRFDIRKGLQLTSEQIEEIKRTDEVQAAREYAFSYASRGPKTEKQFRDKLRERGYGEESRQAAIEMLRGYGYIDDEAYARAYAEELFQANGRWAVNRKLRERGIAREIIEKVTAGADSADALERQLDRLTERNARMDPEKAKARIIRSLAAKGFDFEDIRAAMERRRQMEEDE